MVTAMSKPWLETDAWPAVVRSNARLGLRATWGFAAVWLLISSPILFVLPDELAQSNYLALLGLLFPAVGLGMIWYAVKLTREWRKYGVTTLALDPYPGSLGGHVGGTVALPPEPGVAYQFTLECVRSYVSGSGEDRSRKESVRWQASGPGAQVPGGIAFRFDVPADLPCSELQEGDQYHYWRVQLRSDAANIPLDRTFVIGVFATAADAQGLAIDTSAANQAAAASTVDDALADPRLAERLRLQHGLSIEQRGEWLRLVLHAGRQKGMAVGMLVVGLVFAAVGWFVPGDDFGALMLKGVFGLFGWGLLLGAGYLPFNRLEVRVGPTEIKRARAWFGLVVRRQRIRPGQIARLEITRGASTQSGRKTTIYYRLVGKGAFGEFQFLESIPDKPLVEAVRDQIMRYAGLTQTGP